MTSTRDEELIQQFQTKSDILLQKAQQYLTTALSGGPGVFVYVVMSNLVGKLFGNTREYVEKAIQIPVTLPDFVYAEPLDEELEEFFDREQFKELRAEFPANYADFSDEDWLNLRRSYMPLYFALYVREPFVTEMFSFEIQNHDYKRIIQDFDLFPLYKKSLEDIPSASRQNALWKAVQGVLGETVQEVWNKEYAKELFEEAKSHPEVATLVNDIKTQVYDTLHLNEERITAFKEAYSYVTGYNFPSTSRGITQTSLQVVEYFATVTDNETLEIPASALRELHLAPHAQVRVLVFDRT